MSPSHPSYVYATPLKGHRGGRRRGGMESCTIEHTDKIKFSHGPAMDNSIFLFCFTFENVLLFLLFLLIVENSTFLY